MPAEARTKTPPPRGSSPANVKESESKAVPADKTEKPKGGSNKSLIIGLVVAVAAFGAFKVLGANVDTKKMIEDAVKFVQDQGDVGVYWYCLFTFIGVVCLVPTTPMEFAGGFLFSPMYGMWTTLAFTGASKLCANVVSVLIARFVVKEWVHKNVVAKSELLTMVSTAVKEEPWKMAFLVRGSMVPLFVKNYGLGVMDIGYLPNAGCSCIFTNFYAFQNIYMGAACQNLAEVFAPKKAAAGPTDWMGMAKKMMPIAFNVILVIMLIKAVKAQIKKQKAQIESNLKEKKSDEKKKD